MTLRLRRTALAVAAATALPLIVAAPPIAAQDDDHARLIEDRTATAGSDKSEAPQVAPTATAEQITVDEETEPVAPGLVHTSFDQYGPRGWVRADVLTAELDQPGLALDYLSSGQVSNPQPLSQMLQREPGFVAGTNADFFDISDTGAPLGVGVDREDGLIHAPADGHNTSLTIEADRTAEITDVYLEAQVTTGAGSLPTTNLNSPSVARDGIGIYNSFWGDVARRRTVDGATNVRAVTVTDGVVTSNTTMPGEGPIPGAAVEIVGRDTGATALEDLQPGDEVDVDYELKEPGPVVAASGNVVLLRDGELATGNDSDIHPRTAVGIDDDDDRLIFLTVDGRQVNSRGVSLVELGEMLRDLGAEDALNLDGGGSSTMLAREAGEEPAVVNSPSDGGQRSVPNGLGFHVAPGSGELTDIALEPAQDQEGSRRVHAGLTRTLVANGHDETLAAVDSAPIWWADPMSVGRVDRPGTREETVVVSGLRRGTVRVSATDRDAQGAIKLQVLGPVERIDTDVEQVALPSIDATRGFTVRGYDRDGFSTWVEPRDVDLAYDRAIIEVTASGSGFTVTPRVDSGSAVIALAVDGVQTYLGVTIGLVSEVVDPMDDSADWTASSFPSVVQAQRSVVEGRNGAAIALDYSLTGTTATRAAYLNASPAPLRLPGSPQRVGVWVNGDGQGAWLRAVVVDASGVNSTLNLAASVNWTGWRYVSTTVPAGLQGPLTFRRMYVVETDRNKQYGGRLVFDDLTVESAPVVDVPDVPAVEDRVVLKNAELGADRWTFAVLSDAQFVAAQPDSRLVAQARRTLREIKAVDPDFVVVNGDFVDTGFDEDFELAQRILEEELGDLPYYYVPGNHEAYGPGDLSNFRAVFGEPVRTFDHLGTRFVLLDSSRGSFLLGGFAQVLLLQQALEEARDDSSISNVVVMAHHPTEDPAIVDNSELSDDKEAALLRDWLADFRVDTGKGAAYIAAHAGVFHASRVDGVPYLINGNSGKAPAAAPSDGGFTGWTLVGVDPDAKQAWLRAQIRPHVDALRLSDPGVLLPGESVDVSATVVQEGRQVPVDYPVSASWSGSRHVHIGPAVEARPRDVATYDPESGELVAHREGLGELTVTVNGASQTTQVAVQS
ncbi:MAG: phosphodiester glycosidase family protein [Nocardioidaceae bacterium]|nr:phosphodiester glycosidase family protein [Nocardioidaceae bacterium]